MARAVRKKELTAEERLAAALVPEEEQPYKVPGNWCWVRLGSIATNQYGYTAKSVFDDALPKMLRITDIQDGGVNWKSVPNCAIENEALGKYILKENDIVIARTGATTGKSYLLKNPVNSVFASYLIRLRVEVASSAQYIYKFLQSDLYWKQIIELASGIAQPGVNSSKLLSMMVPLPPLPEQQRIVTLIESLFADLDEAKEKLTAVVEGFAQRKAAILHQAFTGELTAKWREENRNSLDDWNEVAFDDCVDRMQNGLSKRNGHEGKDYAVLRLANIGSDDIVTDDLRYIMLNDKEQEKYELYTQTSHKRNRPAPMCGVEP